MKLGILEALLDREELPLWDFSLEFAEQHKGLIAFYGAEAFERTWNYAAAVISDYNETGGARVGGPGLNEPAP